MARCSPSGRRKQAMAPIISTVPSRRPPSASGTAADCGAVRTTSQTGVCKDAMFRIDERALIRTLTGCSAPARQALSAPRSAAEQTVADTAGHRGGRRTRLTTRPLAAGNGLRLGCRWRQITPPCRPAVWSRLGHRPAASVHPESQTRARQEGRSGESHWPRRS